MATFHEISCIAKIEIVHVSRQPYCTNLEAGLQKEDNGEDSVQVVEGVDQERPRLEPDILQGHDKAAEQDQGQDHRLKVLVLNQSEGRKKTYLKLFLYERKLRRGE
jgi:hypothetical protein